MSTKAEAALIAFGTNFATSDAYNYAEAMLTLLSVHEEIIEGGSIYTFSDGSKVIINALGLNLTE
jgi:hypothetical protein